MSNGNYEMYGGSLCITDLMDALKKGHSAFSKSPKNGKVYANIIEFVREFPDDYGQSVSIQLSSVKEKREEEKTKFGKANYVGNCKKLETNAPVSDRSASNLANDGWDANVPTRADENTGNASQNSNEVTEPMDELPF